MEYSRNEYQEIAMSIIYDTLTYDSMGLDYDIKELISDIAGLPYEEIDLFLKEIVVKSINYRDEIIKKIEPKLVNWTFVRLNRLAQAILIMSVTHYFYIGNVDKAIVINVAVVLAKKYLISDDYKFINALLDNVLC